MRRVVYALLVVLALGAAWWFYRASADVPDADEVGTAVEGSGPRGPVASELRGSANDVPPEPAFDLRPVWPPIVGPYRVEVWGWITKTISRSFGPGFSDRQGFLRALADLPRLIFPKNGHHLDHGPVCIGLIGADEIHAGFEKAANEMDVPG